MFNGQPPVAYPVQQFFNGQPPPSPCQPQPSQPWITPGQPVFYGTVPPPQPPFHPAMMPPPPPATIVRAVEKNGTTFFYRVPTVAFFSPMPVIITGTTTPPRAESFSQQHTASFQQPPPVPLQQGTPSTKYERAQNEKAERDGKRFFKALEIFRSEDSCKDPLAALYATNLFLNNRKENNCAETIAYLLTSVNTMLEPYQKMARNDAFENDLQCVFDNTIKLLDQYHSKIKHLKSISQIIFYLGKIIDAKYCSEQLELSQFKNIVNSLVNVFLSNKKIAVKHVVLFARGLCSLGRNNKLDSSLITSLEEIKTLLLMHKSSAAIGNLGNINNLRILLTSVTPTPVTQDSSASSSPSAISGAGFFAQPQAVPLASTESNKPTASNIALGPRN
jgi:hypothetical protein